MINHFFENAGPFKIEKLLNKIDIDNYKDYSEDKIFDVKDLISATNKDLNAEIKNGNFREDLFHRLAVILIEVPPLKNRKEDIDLLVKYFVKSIAKDQGLEIKTFDPKSIESLKNYPWSGNIRELRNVVERLMILGDNPITQENINQFAPK